jgi:FtsP/CotA-like multicopper oxidase with cupredoxin domain
MSTGSWLVADLVAAVLAAAAWLGAGAASAARPGAGAASAARRRRAALVLAVVALLATVGRAVTVIALAHAGWWFAEEKVLIAGPLSLAAVVVAGSGWLRPVPLSVSSRQPRPVPLSVSSRQPRPVPLSVSSRQPRPVPLLFAGYAETSALLVTVLHGYPATVGAGLFAIGFVAVATAMTWRVLGSSPSRAISRVTLVVAAAALLIGSGVASASSAAPAVPHHHEYSEAAVGEPTKRFTLTAGTATIRVGGRDVPAWAFNGQVPGPELTATVGDILEVTLRNRNITAGVTLHWHGYDVPNSQDGVPGVTQAAVLPGQEFVYRFRAGQAGTYWYHTHADSDRGVRMGLYGVLVVRPPSASTGVDVTVPVHTLAGVALPLPRVASVPAGEPVRLRLINTDDTTHRFALVGTVFRVAAIDGSDLQGPTSLVDTAVLVPAGGRYDLVFTAPAAPVGLYADGRLVYSTGRASAPSSRLPVLDPLAYGSGFTVPWTHYDRQFTLVLDRGLDLHGLVPRYAYTVNGKADPDIPPQVVHLGDIVKFTIVNRSLVVHPWHLHGHRVLVLSRNGQPATGSPLWLDSFDVRPGDVWEVAFVADNPGMWANHCHNLAHADEGMTLHMMYA